MKKIKTKTMKRKFWIAGLLISFGIIAVSAQRSTFNIQGGLNVTNYSISEENSMKLGFRAGIGADVALTDFISVQPSLLVLTKGAKLGSKSYIGDVTINPMYLQLPVLIAFKFPISDNFKMFVNAGPYAAYGISGKADIKLKAFSKEGISNSVDLFKEHEIFNDKSFLKKFDAGAMVGVGVEFSRIFFVLGAEVGITEVTDFAKFIQRDDDDKIRNVGFHVSTGFKF